MKLEAAALSDPGRVRSLNEDTVWAQVFSPSQGSAVGIFMVCDGLGGHMGGENASYWAVETVKRELSSVLFPPDPRATMLLSSKELEAALQDESVTRQSKVMKLEERIIQAVERANQVVYEYAQKKPETAANAGTTISLAVIQERLAVIANVGDSRTYLLRKGALNQITKDHSLVASLVASGQIKPEEVYTHPQRNLIFRSLGQATAVQVDTYWQVLKAGDILLLCSDGLWEMVRDDSLIVRLIEKAKTLEEASQALVKAANAAGGEDNIGVVLVKVY